MKSAICGFYKALYTETETWRPLTNGLPLNQLRVVDRDSLELPFTEEEVLKALSECCGHKAPGPDGMTMVFLKHNWVTLKGDVMRCLQSSFHRGNLWQVLILLSSLSFPRKRGLLISKTFDRLA